MQWFTPAGAVQATIKTAPGEGNIAWSPDSSKLAAASIPPGGERELAVYKLSGFRIVAAQPPYAKLLAWAGNDTVLSLSELSSDYHRMNMRGELENIKPDWRVKLTGVATQSHREDRFAIALAKVEGAARIPAVAIVDNAGNRLALFETGTSVVEHCTCVAWSPDGQQLLTGHLGGQVRLWDASGTRVAEVQAHGYPVRKLAWKGAHIVSGCNGHDLKVWNHQLQPVATLPHTIRVINTAVAGRRLAVASLLRTGMYAGNGQFIDGGGRIAQFDENGELLSAVSAQLLYDQSRLHFEPSGNLLMSTNRGEVWRFMQPRLKHNGYAFSGLQRTAIRCSSMSPDGSKLLMDYDSKICVWDARQRKMVFEPQPHKQRWICSMQWNATGSHFAMGGYNGLCCYYTSSGKRVATHTLKGTPAYAVAISPSGESIAVGSNAGLHIFSQKMEQQRLIVLPGGPVTQLLWKGDQLIAAIGSDVYVLEPSGKKLHMLRGHTNDVTFLGEMENKTLVSAGLDGAWRLWDIETGELLRTTLLAETGDRFTVPRGGPAAEFNAAIAGEYLQVLVQQSNGAQQIMSVEAWRKQQ